jgi:hypothetical protein
MSMSMDVVAAAWNVAEDFPQDSKHKLGARGLAEKIGENPNTFAHALSESYGKALRITTCVRMTQFTGDLRILQSFAAACGQMLMPLPVHLDATGDDCIRALGDTAKEFGELVTEVSASLGNDGSINANELSRIRREAFELVAQLHTLLARAEANHLAHLPKDQGTAAA